MLRMLDVPFRALQPNESQLIALCQLINVALLFSTELETIDNHKVDLRYAEFPGHPPGAGPNHEFLVQL